MTQSLFEKNENLYAILKVPKTATAAEIRKSYLRLSLSVHPDRNPSESATQEFQKLSAAYSILSDSEKRATYDQFGLEGNNLKLWDNLSEADVEAFSQAYIGSEAQRADVVATYIQVKGDVKRFLAFQILASARNLDIYREMVQKGHERDPTTVPYYPKFWDRSQDDRLMQKEEREEEEAKQAMEQRKKKKSGSSSSDFGSLVSTIRSRRNEQFTSLIDSLEQKYGGTSKVQKASRGKRTAKAAFVEDDIEMDSDDSEELGSEDSDQEMYEDLDGVSDGSSQDGDNASEDDAETEDQDNISKRPKRGSRAKVESPKKGKKLNTSKNARGRVQKRAPLAKKGGR